MLISLAWHRWLEENLFSLDGDLFSRGWRILCEVDLNREQIT